MTVAALSGVMARNRTYAARAAERPQPRRRYSQAEHRDRRLKALVVGHYDGRWSLACEIDQTVTPLAAGIAADKRPTRFNRCAATVTELAEAVHEAVGVIVGWVAEADALARTKHLAHEPGRRRAAVTLMVDMAPRPALPDITNEMLKSGEWAVALTGMAEGIDTAFSALLGRAHPPNAAALRGQPSRSDLLARLLDRTIDHAAQALQRRLDRDDHGEDHPTGPTESDCARAKLAALGIDTEEIA